MSSIKDVAKLAGVSIGTVSNVINQTRYVSPDKVILVNKAINELNFRVNTIASSMKAKKTNTIGLVATNITRVFYSHVINGMQRAATKNGITLSIQSTYNNLQAEKDAIDRFCSNMVDAIILDTSADISDMDYFIKLSSLKNNSKQIPVMSIENNLAQYGINSIYIDGMQSSETATGHLISIGCRRIVHIKGPESSCLSRERLIGYKKALVNADLIVDENFILSGDFSQHSGYIAMKEFIEKGYEFDGVFAANDQMIIGACKAIQQSGRSVPNDVKLVGFDNSFVASIFSPSITTIDVPKDLMGFLAVDELSKILENGSFSQCLSICLPTNLIIRESSDKNAQIEKVTYEW